MRAVVRDIRSNSGNPDGCRGVQASGFRIRQKGAAEADLPVNDRETAKFNRLHTRRSTAILEARSESWSQESE